MKVHTDYSLRITVYGFMIPHHVSRLRELSQDYSTCGEDAEGEELCARHSSRDRAQLLAAKPGVSVVRGGAIFACVVWRTSYLPKERRGGICSRLRLCMIEDVS